MLKTYFTDLKKLVLPQLINFKEDLTVHDKTMLSKYSFKNEKYGFLYGWRESGTDMFIVDDIVNSIKDIINNPLSNDNSYFKQSGIDKIRKNEFNLQDIYYIAAFKTNRNKNYLMGKSGKLVQLTNEQFFDQLKYVEDVINNLIYKAHLAYEEAISNQ